MPCVWPSKRETTSICWPWAGPRGRGCYCAANHMLRSIMDGINAGYDYVVMDNEAGMEHLSRRTTRDVDHLLLVSDASLRGHDRG